MKSYIIDLYGRVQGTALRIRIRNHAKSKNLSGTVRNLSSGVTRISLNASDKELTEFIYWLKHNPGPSLIDHVVIKEQTSYKEMNGFHIIRNNNIFVDQFNNLKSIISHTLSKRGTLPRHVVIIPDGNRRWAKKRGLSATAGHEAAASYDHISSLITGADELGIEYLSIWGFSTENWKRSKEEINKLFSLLAKNIDLFRNKITEKDIIFTHVGRKDRLPISLVKKLSELEKMSKNNHGMHLQFLLDYGGRDELANAINSMIKSKVKKVDENIIKSHLYTATMPDPDLIIRTSGEQRTSGLMPFQSIYAELYFARKNFPSFGRRDLRKAVVEFMKRKRRFGGN